MRCRKVFLVLPLVLLLHVSAALAQRAAPSPQATPSRTTGGNVDAAATPRTQVPTAPDVNKTGGSQAQSAGRQGIEEIVVTAQKRTELAQDVPISLTALGAENLRFRGIEDLSDLHF